MAITINPTPLGGGGGGLQPTIRATAPVGSSVTCDGQTKVVGAEGYVDFVVDIGTYTVTATLDGKTATEEVMVDRVGLFPVKIEYIAHPEIAWSGTGTWVSIYNRTFSKVNEGVALCGAVYGLLNGAVYTMPLLVSQDEECCYYRNSHDNTLTTLVFEVMRNGKKWYVSGTEYAWSGNRTSTFYNVDGKRVDISSKNYTDATAFMVASANALLDYYYGI